MRIIGHPGIAPEVAERLNLPYDDLSTGGDAEAYLVVVTSATERTWLHKKLDEDAFPIFGAIAWRCPVEEILFLADEEIHLFVGLPDFTGDELAARVEQEDLARPNLPELNRLRMLSSALHAPAGVYA